MDRKHFIKTIAPIALLSNNMLASGLTKQQPTAQNNLKTPKYLRKGDTVGVTCPAGYLTEEEMQPFKIKLEKDWGLKVKQGKTVGLRHGTFAGTDEERRADMQAMLDDSSIQAIMCGRGGYGCNRIIDGLDFTQFKKNPKWLIGFSDITLLHTHLNSNLGIASIHSKMCNSFLSNPQNGEALQLDSIESIQRALFGVKMQYATTSHNDNKYGSTTGKLVGGNLSIIYSAMGTASQLNTNKAILFLEEVDEKLYTVDRMMWNLRRSGMLKNLKGLIIGGFKMKAADKPENEFGETLQQIVLNVTKDYKYPVCFDFPVGHQKVNYALKCGITHHLSVGADVVTLKEV
jgi:muramoyltetrapeptide carboxypeptidase